MRSSRWSVGRSLTSRRRSARNVVVPALVLLAVALTGCGGPSFTTATELPKAPRRPDGVALDAPPALPSASYRAEARGVVGLREPLAEADVEDIVRAYLRGFEREDEQALASLLTDDATSLARPGSSRQQLIEIWRTKMKAFEYQRIAGHEIAHLSEIERHTYDTLGSGGSPARPPSMRPGDIYVRVPLSAPRSGSDQLFGDVLVLLLRREDGRLKIAGQADDNGSP